MRIAIIGAGFAGLATAKVLSQVGHEVVVFDKTPDVGGVWSRHPPLPGRDRRRAHATCTRCRTSRCPRATPSGRAARRCRSTWPATRPHFGLDRHCGSTPRSPRPRPTTAAGPSALRRAPTARASTTTSTGWSSPTASSASRPVPTYPGATSSRPPAGRLCAATEFLDAEEARGKQVVVVGYGKSACDVAVAISDAAAGTAVIARQLLWKVPRRSAASSTSSSCCSPGWARRCSATAPARGGEVPARARQRDPPQHAQLRRVDVGAASTSSTKLGPAAAGHDGGHRPRRDRAGHRRVLRAGRATARSSSTATRRSPGCSSRTAHRTPN